MPNRITEARKIAGLSQRELAKRMGLKPSTVSGYESGTSDPKSDGLMKIAEICSVTVDYLLGLSDDPKEILTVTITDGDPQLMQIEELCTHMTADGMQRVIEYAEDLLHNPKYQKKKPPVQEAIKRPIAQIEE